MHMTAPSHWSRSIVTGGRDASERVVTIAGMRMHDPARFRCRFKLTSGRRFSAAPISRLRRARAQEGGTILFFGFLNQAKFRSAHLDPRELSGPED